MIIVNGKRLKRNRRKQQFQNGSVSIYRKLKDSRPNSLWTKKRSAGCDALTFFHDVFCFCIFRENMAKPPVVSDVDAVIRNSLTKFPKYTDFDVYTSAKTCNLYSD